MDPIQHEAFGISDFIEVIQRYKSTEGWDFRGQAKLCWPLVPKAGRDQYFCRPNPLIRNNDHIQVSGDLGRFDQWKHHAVAIRDPLPANEFDCLAYAQHYGLATRLLDWTTNPLVALFFAVETDLATDGAVFCYFPLQTVPRATAILDEYKLTARFVPPQFDRRIVAQSGVFSYHYDPRAPIEAEIIPSHAPYIGPDTRGKNLAVIKVPAAQKESFQARLSELGITKRTLFPDLDGVSAYVNWGTQMDKKYRP